MHDGEVAARERAEEVVHTALDHLRDSQDPYMRVRLYWSLARLAANEGRSKTALANIRKAIALLEQVVTESQTMKLPENRIRVQISAGDMLWAFYLQ